MKHSIAPAWHPATEHPSRIVPDSFSHSLPVCPASSARKAPATKPVPMARSRSHAPMRAVGFVFPRR